MTEENKDEIDTTQNNSPTKRKVPLKKLNAAIPLLFNNFNMIKKREKKVLKTWHELNLTEEPLEN